jgi:hypothetical protein
VRTKPDPERIFACAVRLARELHGIQPPEADLRERIEHVLWGRKQAWSLLDDGIISEVELRNLLIDHLDYECAHLSGHAWARFDEADRLSIVDALDEALFGRPAQD